MYAIAIAVVVSLVALLLAFRFRGTDYVSAGKVASAGVMGIAVAGMHVFKTGLTSTQLEPILSVNLNPVVCAQVGPDVARDGREVQPIGAAIRVSDDPPPVSGRDSAPCSCLLRACSW